MKNGDCRQNRNDRNQIDVDTCFHRPQSFHSEIPGHKTGGGSAQSQKCNLKKIHRISEAFQLKMEIRKIQGRQHKNQPVNENPPGGRNGIISLGSYFFHKIRIKGPDYGRQNRQ